MLVPCLLTLRVYNIPTLSAPQVVRTRTIVNIGMGSQLGVHSNAYAMYRLHAT